MTWKKPDSLVGASLARHNLTAAVQAGLVCQEAERRYPGLFRAISIVRGSLHIHTTPEQVIPFRLIEGKLLTELATYAKSNHLPIPTKIRLTISSESGTV